MFWANVSPQFQLRTLVELQRITEGRTCSVMARDRRAKSMPTASPSSHVVFSSSFPSVHVPLQAEGQSGHLLAREMLTQEEGSAASSLRDTFPQLIHLPVPNLQLRTTPRNAAH
ncbi:unnamed protein product [Lepidochelys olivacea]